ncbi:MAG: Fe-S cluster assembly protein SufD [Deltaproteobacteria bacterium]|nr:Fe-S cluster assembly protein SufD [Deltaproteobacteria bacterium]
MHTAVTQLATDAIGRWSAARGEPAWLTAQRTQCWEQFQQLPVPPKTDEAWKYTDLERLSGWDRTTWATSSNPTAAISTDAANVAAGIIYTDLATALARHADLLTPYLATHNDGAAPRRAFSGLSGHPYQGQRYLSQQEALWDRGYLLYIPDGVTAAVPFHTTTCVDTDGSAIFPRTIVILGENAAAICVDEYAAADGLRTTVNSCHARSELYLGAGSRLHYVTVQHWHESMRHLVHQHATVARDAHFTSTTITLGGQMSKGIIESALTAPGAESLLFGIAFGNGTQHFDHHTLQTHLAPNTHSDLLYKTALKGHARSIYTGLIRMTPAAQQSQAYQANRNLLLAPGTQASAIPQLEIEANDVKCSHGATIGPIDEDQCYYLRSRGFTRGEAESMIVGGFFEDLLVRIPDEHVRDVVRAAIGKQLEG